MIACLLSCTADTTPWAEPVATLTPGEAFVGPTRLLVVELDRPAPLQVVLSGGDDQRSFGAPSAVRHELPLVGLLPDEAYTLEVAAGADRWDMAFETEPVPTEGVPDLQVLVTDPGRAEPGWTLVSFTLLGDRFASGVLLLDEQLRIRWWWLESTGLVDDDLVIAPDGALWRRHRQELVVADWLGRISRRYLVDPSEGDGPDVFRLDSGRNHHDTVPLADGTFWVLGFDSVEMEVPVAYGSTETRLATVQDTPVFHLAADGSVIERFSTAEHIQPGRCGWDGLSEKGFGIDALHANALEILPGDGFLVTLRNQDVALRVEEDGEVRWRLGDPAGWTEPWSSSFLRPIGQPTWPLHAHGADLLADGTYVAFDNHNAGGTPYGPEDDALSRVLLARVDEQERTIDVFHTNDQTAVGPLDSYILGDADLLPETGNVLAVWGAVQREGDVTNVELGLGRQSGHLVEQDPAHPGQVVLDVRFTAPKDPWWDGVVLYRAERVAPP